MPVPVKGFYTEEDLTHPYAPNVPHKPQHKPVFNWSDSTVLFALAFLIAFLPNPLNY